MATEAKISATMLACMASEKKVLFLVLHCSITELAEHLYCTFWYTL